MTKSRPGLRDGPVGTCPGRQPIRGAETFFYKKSFSINKYLNNISLQGRQIISLPGAPTYERR
jgi:hypothetical protein